MSKKPKRTPTSESARLPNAPLIEVVFELRWKLYGTAPLPVTFHSDPGLLPLVYQFKEAAARLGFAHTQELGGMHEAAAYGILRRFKKNDDEAFPLLQIGAGIFAANQGPQYEWEQYKRLVLQGTQALLESYPKLAGFALEPIYLEIRYINAFDETLLNTSGFSDFLEQGTIIRIDEPSFLRDDELFKGQTGVRATFNKEIKTRRASRFSIDLATILRSEQRAVRLESKVATQKDGVPQLSTPAHFLEGLESWLEFARGITSPFFKGFVTPDLRKLFEVKKDGV